MTSAIGVTQHRVRLELAQENAADLECDDAVIIHRNGASASPRLTFSHLDRTIHQQRVLTNTAPTAGIRCVQLPH
jgi:hypothetical protein